MARDPQELARAVESLGPGVPAAGVVGDVRLPDSCAQTVDEVIARFGRLDVLVNNAGLILSAPLARTGVDDFEALMDVHFWGTLHMTSAALPHLLARPGGRVANICSIGGKVAVPHLSAYCASKFAQAGLSAVLREELRQHGVTVTTVFPGLMRTGSHVQARFRGDAGRESPTLRACRGDASSGDQRRARGAQHRPRGGERTSRPDDARVDAPGCESECGGSQPHGGAPVGGESLAARRAGTPDEAPALDRDARSGLAARPGRAGRNRPRRAGRESQQRALGAAIAARGAPAVHAPRSTRGSGGIGEGGGSCGVGVVGE